MSNLPEVFIGVDISKKNLDIFIHPIGQSIRINNSKQDIIKFIKQLEIYKVRQIACEATGGYEKLLAKVLKKHEYNLWIVDPRRIKGFIISTGCKSKTDKIDAKKIAEFAAKHSPDYEKIIKSQNEEKLQSFVSRKADLTQFLSSEKTRLKHPSHVLCETSINKIISFLEKEIKFIDEKISQLISKDEELSRKVNLLTSIPGIGNHTAALLVSFVPEIGHLSNNQIAALVGLCPYNRESGDYKGKRFIRGGRVIPRNALYMCALTTIKFHLPLKDFYNRLIEKKKPFKVAIVAVMRKLLIIANVILKKGEVCKA